MTSAVRQAVRGALGEAARRPGAAVFFVALAARLIAVAWAHGRFPPSADGFFYHRLAARIAAGQGYTWLWPDGAVTAAAHYPVGYPALIAGPYALFGPSPTVAMIVNALVGALGCLAVQRLVARSGHHRASLVAGGLSALHPTLIAYTPALMTEGVVGSLLTLGAWAAISARRRRLPIVLLGLVMGLCTLVRPQSVLLAPAFGFLVGGGLRRRLLAAGATLVITLSICAPWTLRNCAEMGRCAFVSVNGGWNLLIGTEPDAHGTWAPLEPPPACRTVWDEAEKDVCFRDAALERILAAPGAFVALAPQKLSATFDQGGAPGWYLHAANAEAFGATARDVLTVLEIACARLSIALALLAVWVRPRRTREQIAAAVIACGVLVAVYSGALAFGAFVVAVALRRERAIVLSAPALAVVATAVVHAVFFGGGRYQLVLFPLLCAPAALGALRAAGVFKRHLPSVAHAAREPASSRDDGQRVEEARS